jgi:phospholipid/cholesterol/gamma-HCH transport system substrate-binding protein
MLTRSPALRSIVFMVVFFLAAFALLLFVWQRFGGVAPLSPKGYRVHVHFGQAQNLQPNADVRMAGVKIGEVVSVTPTTGRTDAVLQIDRQYVPLRQGTHVITRVKTLLGETFVALAPGSRDAPAIPEGGSIANADIGQTQQLDEVLGAFNAKTRTTLRRYLEMSAQSVDGRGADLNDALGHLGPTAQQLDTLISTVDAQRGDLQRFVDKTGGVFDAIARRPEALQGLVRSGDRVLATTDRMRNGLRGTIDSLVPLQRELRTSTGSALAAARLARPTLRTLRTPSRNFGAAINGGERLGRALTSLFHDLPPSLRASRTGLPATQRMLRASGPLSVQLLAAGKQLNPLLDLARAYGKDLVGSFASFSSAMQSTLTGTDGVARHYMRSILAANNETNGKQATRPYTNRHNAYPRPGWLSELTKGTLSASDCNNATNIDPTAPTVPIGTTGVTPCRVQGGWTFRGHTSYFPQMSAEP